MEPKQSCGKGTRTASDPESTHEEKYQGRVETVKPEAHGVMARRVESEEFDVQHHGEPGKGMPILRGVCREGPSHGRRRNSLLRYRILGEIDAVIEIHKSVLEDATVREEDGTHEASRDQEVVGSPSRAFHGVPLLRRTAR